MGILFVLMFYAVAFTIAASAGAAILSALTWRLTRRSQQHRKRAILLAALFPFACVAYAGAWFVAYAVVSYTIFHRDPGLGDTWETPLPNGYQLEMIDVTDEGAVYNPKTQPSRDGVVGRDDAVFGVRQLQVAGALIYGARDSHYFEHIGQNSSAIDKYFELDTKQDKLAEVDNLNSLRERAATRGVSLNLRPFQSVFGDYRTTWFDYLSGAILLLLPLSAFFILARWVWRIRQNRPQAHPTQ